MSNKKENSIDTQRLLNAFKNLRKTYQKVSKPPL